MRYPNLKKNSKFCHPNHWVRSFPLWIVWLLACYLPLLKAYFQLAQKVGISAIPKLFGECPLPSCETCCFTLITYLNLFDILIIERQFSHFSNYPNPTSPRGSKPPEKSLATETWWNMIPTKKKPQAPNMASLNEDFFGRRWQRSLKDASRSTSWERDWVAWKWVKWWELLLAVNVFLKM